MRKTLLAACTAAFLACLPGVALAQPSLTTSTPAAGSTVAKPTKIALGFNETLTPAHSSIVLVMTAMPGMSHHQPMPIKGFTVETKGKAMTVTLPRALPAGTYALTWNAMGADQKHAQGSYTFTVR